MSIGSIPDTEQLPDGTWQQIRGLVKSGHDAMAIAIATGVTIARAERHRREMSFKPPAVVKKQWRRR